MVKTTPSGYLKSVRQTLESLSADACNELLCLAHKSDGVTQRLRIPADVPQKYHARMQLIWMAMLFNVSFKKATDKYTLIQRHDMLQKAYRSQYLVNQSER